MTKGRTGQGLRPGLGEIGDSLRDALLRRAGRLSARYQERTGLAVDLLESDDAYLAVFDAPGADQSDVQVRYVGGSVLVRIDRFRDYYEGFAMRFPGRGLSLDGEVELPEDALVDVAEARATLTGSGTLEVELPKREDYPDAAAVEVSPEEADVAGESPEDADVFEGNDAEGSDVGGSDVERGDVEESDVEGSDTGDGGTGESDVGGSDAGVEGPGTGETDGEDGSTGTGDGSDRT